MVVEFRRVLKERGRGKSRVVGEGRGDKGQAKATSEEMRRIQTGWRAGDGEGVEQRDQG